MSATTTYPYTFDSSSRIGNDNVAIDQRNIQNMNNYQKNQKKNNKSLCCLINLTYI